MTRGRGLRITSFQTSEGESNWASIQVTRGLDVHTICWVIICALLVFDRLCVHAHNRTGVHSMNVLIVANPITIGGKGRYEFPFTMVRTNDARNVWANNIYIYIYISTFAHIA